MGFAYVESDYAFGIEARIITVTTMEIWEDHFDIDVKIVHILSNICFSVLLGSISSKRSIGTD